MQGAWKAMEVPKGKGVERSVSLAARIFMSPMNIHSNLLPLIREKLGWEGESITHLSGQPGARTWTVALGLAAHPPADPTGTPLQRLPRSRGQRGPGQG